MAHGETLAGDDVPFYARQLIPYIKTREDALRIRQQLTAYLCSQIVIRDESDDRIIHVQPHLGLCVPQDVAISDVRIPPEVAGLRKRYLEAIKANVAAKKKYQAASEEITSARAGDVCKGERLVGSEPVFQTYLRLVRNRQRHAKAQVFQHYLEKLKSRDIAGPEYFEHQTGASPPPALTELFNGDKLSDREKDIECLVRNLERAVIRAKSELDREKKLFEEVKSRCDITGTLADVPVSMKVNALQRTRDELVQWIEEKLVNMDSDDADRAEELYSGTLEDAATLLDEYKVQISKQYAAYVKAREALLDAASSSCLPIGISTAKPRPFPSRDETTLEYESSLCPLDILAFMRERFLPLSKTQQTLTLQRSYLSEILDREKETALRMLSRLGDESHLLPTYPMQARQPRLKHATSAAKSRRSSAGETLKSDEIANIAEAWAFASSAARKNEKEYVERRMTVGDEALQNAEKTLQEAYDILNQSPKEAILEEQSDKSEVPCTWMSEKRSKSPLYGCHAAQLKGPWARVNGQVDMDSCGPFGSGEGI